VCDFGPRYVKVRIERRLADISPIGVTQELVVRIDKARIVKWTRGQSFRIFFKDELLFLNPIISSETQEASIGSNITIYTDARNRLRNPSPYSAKIATLTSSDFLPGLLSKRYVDIICENPDTFEFYIDIPN
jgi:hypothetical protein